MALREGSEMSEPKRGWTDEQVEHILGYLLRVGVSIAALVVSIGGVLYLLHYGATFPDYQLFRGEPADVRSVSGIISDILSLRSRGLIQFGLLLLIATPVARVGLSLFAFARQHDWTYVVVTLIVFALLLYSLLGSHP